jgi:hypothetical protein
LSPSQYLGIAASLVLFAGVCLPFMVGWRFGPLRLADLGNDGEGVSEAIVLTGLAWLSLVLALRGYTPALAAMALFAQLTIASAFLLQAEHCANLAPGGVRIYPPGTVIFCCGLGPSPLSAALGWYVLEAGPVLLLSAAFLDEILSCLNRKVPFPIRPLEFVPWVEIAESENPPALES